MTRQRWMLAIALVIGTLGAVFIVTSPEMPALIMVGFVLVIAALLEMGEYDMSVTPRRRLGDFKDDDP